MKKASKKAAVGAKRKAKEVTRADGAWQNFKTGGGTFRDKVRANRPYQCAPLAVQDCAAMWEGDHLARRIVGKIVADSLRRGISFESGATDASADDSQELNTELMKAWKRWNATRLLIEAGTWGRRDGGAGIFLGVKGAGKPFEPLEDDNIGPGALRYMTVFTRRDLIVDKWYEDPLDEKYAEPELYRINPVSAGFILKGSDSVVHESRLIMFDGVLTDKLARRQNQGWCHSVLQPVFSALQEFAEAWGGIVGLMSDLAQGVYSIENLIKMILGGNEDLIAERFRIMDDHRSSRRGILLDAKNEKFERIATPLAGASDLVDRLQQNVSGAAEMPVTILFGRSPAGMNATGEADTLAWYDTVEAYQSNSMGPNAQRLGRVIALSEGIDGAEDLTPCFPSLWQPTAKEKADIYKTTTDADVANVNAGMVLAEEVTLARSKKGALDPGFPQVDLKVRAEALKAELVKLKDDAGKPDEPPPAQLGPDGKPIPPKAAPAPVQE